MSNYEEDNFLKFDEYLCKNTKGNRLKKFVDSV